MIRHEQNDHFAMKRTVISLLPLWMLLILFSRFALAEGSDARPSRPRPKSAKSAPVRIRKKTAGSRLNQDEIRALTRLHNKARADVGVAPLAWSADIAAYAQRWADHLAASGCRMEHRPSSGKWRRLYGENLFMGTAGAYGVGDAVEAWVGEKKDYRGKALDGSNWHAAGHYTQVVWRGTRRFGCAKSACRDMVIVVCNYDPPGNVMGQKPF
jgi:pathogenesis-related protein 1